MMLESQVANKTQEQFRIRTFLEASELAEKLAENFPDYDSAYYGLTELMLNAIEHGNLGITFQEKLELLHQDTWLDEVERRLSLPENQNKSVVIEVLRSKPEICITITDMGSGFNWWDYTQISKERAEQPAGRGIATTLALGFAEIRFLGSGNSVECRLAIKA